jgi:hypothetical protein
MCGGLGLVVEVGVEFSHFALQLTNDGNKFNCQPQAFLSEISFLFNHRLIPLYPLYGVDQQRNGRSKR